MCLIIDNDFKILHVLILPLLYDIIWIFRIINSLAIFIFRVLFIFFLMWLKICILFKLLYFLAGRPPGLRTFSRLNVLALINGKCFSAFLIYILLLAILVNSMNKTFIIAGVHHQISLGRPPIDHIRHDVLISFHFEYFGSLIRLLRHASAAYGFGLVEFCIWTFYCRSTTSGTHTLILNLINYK